MKIGVSACLLGHNVRYNGSNKRNDEIIQLLENHEVVCVCPEAAAGLPIPHPPIEILNEEVIDCDGRCYTSSIIKGVQKAYAYSKDCDFFILKAKSPTCGVSRIYDGTFSDTLINADGMFTRVCKDNGKLVFTENDIDEIKTLLKE